MIQELQFAHPRSIDQHAFVAQEDHLARRGGVLPAVVVFAHRLHAKGCVGDPIDDGGLADTGRAHKRSRSSPRQISSHSFDASLLQRTQQVHWSSQSNDFHLRGKRGGVRTEVRFIEQDHRPCAAVPHNSQIALNAPQIELAIQRAHHKHGVEVRGDDLLGHLAPRNFAGELGSPREDVLDSCPSLFRTRDDCDPVSYGRKVFPAGGLILKLARRFPPGTPRVLTSPGRAP